MEKEFNQVSKTPIALFTYNRPNHTQKVLESLSYCRRLDECSLYIFCDGPKNNEQLKNVNASRQVVESFAGPLQAKIIFRDENLGLAHSIVSGVTELCGKYGRVIVIEDDLELSPSFIDFMLQALDRYQDDELVYQISGFMYPIKTPDMPDVFFLPVTTTWGWATWDRAWKKFDWNATGYQKLLSDKKIRSAFDLDDSYPYSNMLKQRLIGKNDSWGILWWYAVFSVQGLVLYPGRTLVYNNGFDGTGTHCEYSREPIKAPEKNTFNIFPTTQIVTFPEKIAIHAQNLDLIKKDLHQSQRNIFQRILRILRTNFLL